MVLASNVSVLMISSRQLKPGWLVISFQWISELTCKNPLATEKYEQHQYSQDNLTCIMLCFNILRLFHNNTKWSLFCLILIKIITSAPGAARHNQFWGDHFICNISDSTMKPSSQWGQDHGEGCGADRSCSRRKLPSGGENSQHQTQEDWTLRQSEASPGRHQQQRLARIHCSTLRQVS